jgi:hypothetical protein
VCEVVEFMEYVLLVSEAMQGRSKWDQCCCDVSSASYSWVFARIDSLRGPGNWCINVLQLTERQG